LEIQVGTLKSCRNTGILAIMIVCFRQNGQEIIIIDIYPGSFTHPKVVFRDVLHPIELEFGYVDF